MQQNQQSGQGSILVGLLLVACLIVVFLWAIDSPWIGKVIDAKVSAAEWGRAGILGILGVAGLVVVIRGLPDVFRILGRVALLLCLALLAIVCVAIWQGEKPETPQEAVAIGQVIGGEAIDQLKHWIGNLYQ